MGFLGFFDKPKCVEESVIEENIEVDFSNFELISEYIYEKSGIIDLDKRALVFTRLKQFSQDSDLHTTIDFLNKMKNEDTFYQEVMNIVTVNETYFFREHNELEWLVNHIKNSIGKVKILSLPSSSGEETYSILMMLDMANVDMSRIEISGYDINSEAVSDADNGFYNTHSLHKVEDIVKSKYFSKTASGLYQITSNFRNMATFKQKNIFELSDETNKYDIVLSRNMFIYFDKQKRHEALNVISTLLKIGGTYIKGHADHIETHPRLENIKFGIYKKI